MTLTLVQMQYMLNAFQSSQCTKQAKLEQTPFEAADEQAWKDLVQQCDEKKSSGFVS